MSEGEESSEVSDDETSSETESGKAATAAQEGQSIFAWIADLVVVINAGSMAMSGFNDKLNPILNGVGYFASLFFIAEAVAKSISYGGWR